MERIDDSAADHRRLRGLKNARIKQTRQSQRAHAFGRPAEQRPAGELEVEGVDVHRGIKRVNMIYANGIQCVKTRSWKNSNNSPR